VSRGRRLFRDRTTATVVGVALVVAGWVCLYDAYDARGRTKPVLMRPAVPF
jgi:hypothetical protein